MAENDINTDNIRDYLARQGGKARNSDVVLHFKEYLNYPDQKKKEYYRQKFKEYINLVAVKKDENGVKYLVLKKKFREPVDSESSPRQWRIGHPHEYEQGTLERSPSRSEAERRSAEERCRQQAKRLEEEDKRHAEKLRQAAKQERERRMEEEKKAQEKKKQEQQRRNEEERIRNERIQEGLKQQEIERMQREKELFDKKSQEEFQKNVIVIVEPSGDDGTDEPDGYTGPSEQRDVVCSKEGERIIEEKAQISSVTDQVQMINKSFESEKSPRSRRKGNAGSQKPISETSRGSDPTLNKDTLSSSGSQASLKSTISGQERLWILYSAQNDLANLSLLLSENKDLAYSKDFINVSISFCLFIHLD
ncbi:golgin subfamily A member 6-like protein 22 [Anneissia japonica]|uniref:golgin subfamily A member 6-like protein 22 n=1 Tax=Anneissia japonica TaxID=1529436 RepID=UPI001425B1D1|nr:golgin subfamily A member 6-like protein 22 [Anneissia japonica]